ncbi:MAG: flagellin [Thermodesulfovibrionales bacterium]
MAISDISLTAGMRANLISLQQTVDLLNRTQTRLSTGKKVNSPLDDPINYFAAQSHMQRASDLALRKDGMNEGIQVLKAADAGIKALISLVQQAKSLITAARTAGATEADELETQYDEIRDQIDALSSDSSYKGVNLLAGDTLTVEFNEDGSNTISVVGFNATVDGDLNISAATDFTISTNLDAAVAELDDALNVLRTQAKTLSSNLSIITTRLEFTTNMISTLQTGADTLTLADMNEEGANMLMLQTRQSLGTTTLSLAAQAAQSILRLF